MLAQQRFDDLQRGALAVQLDDRIDAKIDQQRIENSRQRTVRRRYAAGEERAQLFEGGEERTLRCRCGTIHHLFVVCLRAQRFQACDFIAHPIVERQRGHIDPLP